MEKKLACILPGIGYHKDKPLLYYATKLTVQLGYEVMHISYKDMPTKIQGDASMMRRAAEIAYAQTEEQLSVVDFSAYEDVLFIGKSIGTVALAKYVATHEIQAKQIWYTPVEATFSFDSKNVLAFIGDADPWSDLDVIREKVSKMEISLYNYPRCNHSLECDDVEQNILVLQDVMARSQAFIVG